MRLAPTLAAALLALAVPLGCSSSSSPPSTTPAGVAGTVPAFDLHADLTQSATYWSFPYPSDLRLNAQGAPDERGFPNPLMAATIRDLGTDTESREGFPQLPVAYFTMSAPVGPQDPGKLVPAASSSALLLVDIDPSSSDRGKLFPLVADTPKADRYAPSNLLAVAPWPGVLLHPGRKYAFVLMRAFKDATGAPLGVPAAFAALQAATAPAKNPELAAWTLYQPLWPTLKQIGVDAAQVSAATVFTTGDPVQALADMSDKLRARYPVTVTGLAVRMGGNQAANCEIVGTVTQPQFQVGTPLFDTGGNFQIGADGLPVKQRDEVVPIALSLPQTPMPAGGYPLILYIHGSGGLSTQLFDRGVITSAYPDGTPHQGPAYVMAPHGFAMASSAMPVNPERVPGAPELAYINFNNLAAFPYTFQQGSIEQRLYIDALSKVTINPSVVASCPGVTLPAGATSIKFDVSRLAVQGQSMGGQYANMLSAIDARVGAVAPSGAGGDWSYVVLTTMAIPNAAGDVALLLGTTQTLTFLHPALNLLQTAWEPADAVVFMPRLSRSPLPGHPARAVYEPVGGPGDEYFSTVIYDAMALAYGHKQTGTAVWPTLQTSLALEGLSGLLPYPVVNDLTSDGGKKYTAAVVQYAGDGVANPHYIFQQLDAVKYQYGCFFETYQKTGTAQILAPAALGTPCTGM